MNQPSGPLESLVSAAHRLVPDALPALVDERARGLGVETASIFLIDPDQRWLVPLPREGGTTFEPQSVDGTLAGRCFRSVEVNRMPDAAGLQVVWVPILDGTERLGVLRYSTNDPDPGDFEDLMAFASLVAQLLVTKRAYGDFFELTRRPRPISIAAELLWQLLPPLTFASDDLVISGVFVPTEDVGGDAFDYGVDRQRAQIAIFDAMGHGLAAGLMATAAVAGYRNCRRRQLQLRETAERIGDAIEAQFDEGQFVTGVLASLDVTSGEFSWCVAGHPPPLLVRRGRVVKELDRAHGLPFGIGPASSIFVEQLEPGDRILLYTDGVTEARDLEGKLFGLERLVDTITRVAGDDPPPEALRRLMHIIEDESERPMRDDATVMTIEWRGPGPSQLTM